MLVHGNFGLGAPYGEQIHGFAKDLAARVTWLRSLGLQDDSPHLTDTVPRAETLSDAIAAIAARPDADPNRLGFIGFSLGAATAMTYIANSSLGYCESACRLLRLSSPLQLGPENESFPPTIIFHNEHDLIVPIGNSEGLNRLLPSKMSISSLPRTMNTGR